MDYELAEKRDRGEMPESWYHRATTEKELAALIELLGCGFVIGADSQCGFRFARREGGGYEFGVNAPDRHCNFYATAADGVVKFKVGGRPLIESVAGRRIAFDDCPAPLMPEVTPRREV